MVLDVLMAMLMAPSTTVWCDGSTGELFLWEESSEKEEFKLLKDVQNHILKCLETLIVDNYQTEMYFGKATKHCGVLPTYTDTHRKKVLEQRTHGAANSFQRPYLDSGFAWPRNKKTLATAKMIGWIFALIRQVSIFERSLKATSL